MKTLLFTAAILLNACGSSSVDNELTGQVKRVIRRTPIICPDYVEADISLGVMRNGVGSMSTEDVWLYVEDQSDVLLLDRAAQDGDLVRVEYDIHRVTLCVPDHFLTYVELVK